MKRISPEAPAQIRSERLAAIERADGPSPEDARDALFYSLAGIAEDGIIDLLHGWSAALDWCFAGPMIEITSPTGIVFTAIIELDGRAE